MMSRIIWIIYVLVGVFIANSGGYFAAITSFTDIAHIIMAFYTVSCWPLVLLGVKLDIKL